MIKRWVLLFALLLAALMGAPAFAQDAAIIRGVVYNGTAGGQTPAGVDVVLHIFRDEQQPELRAAVAGDDGSFSFDGVPPDAGRYNITASYAGVAYSLDFTPQDDLSAVSLPVYEPATDRSSLSIVLNSVLVLGADVRTRTLSIVEIVDIRNSGDRVIIPDPSAPMSLLRFPLPDGAFNIDIQAALPEGEVIQVDRGFALTTPVPPGQYGLAFNYLAPYEGSSLQFDRTFLSGAQTYRLLVPSSLGPFTTGGLENVGETALGQTVFTLLEARDVPPNGAALLTIDGLPQPTLFQRAQWWLEEGNLQLIALPSSLALGLLALLFIGLRQRGDKDAVALANAGTDRTVLLQAIAELDDRFALGVLAAEEYTRRRRVLKLRLLGLGRQEALR